MGSGSKPYHNLDVSDEQSDTTKVGDVPVSTLLADASSNGASGLGHTELGVDVISHANVGVDVLLPPTDCGV